MSVLRLVADDLTGALDAGAQFTGARGALPCSLGPVTSWPEGEDLAVNLGCRDGAPGPALAASQAALPLLQGAGTAFKKIDSLLRGHWAAELAACVDGFDLTVLAPAFPAQNRATRGGRQWARLAGDDWTVVEVDPARALSEAGVGSVTVADPSAIPLFERGAVLICDAETDCDLEQICTSLRGAGGHILWCGSAGLARALAGESPRPASLPRQRHLAIVGTNHPVSLKQIAHLADRHPGRVVSFGANARASVARIGDALERWGTCLAVADPGEVTSRQEAADRIAGRLGEVFGQLPAPGALTVTGGETFLALCRGIGADHLLLTGEYAPGLPVSRMVGGRWDGTPVLSKSGAFGGEDLFTALLGPDP